MQILLSGELAESLAPKGWGTLQEIRSVSQQTFRSASFWVPFLVVTVVMWTIASVRIIRKLRKDKAVPKILALPYDVAPPAIFYWKREIFLGLWFLLCVIALVIYLVTL